MWAWTPTSSTPGRSSSAATASAAAPAASREPELRVLLARPHELVGVDLDAGGDPHEHPGPGRTPRRRSSRPSRSISSNESTTIRPTPPSRARGQLGLGLVVAVQDQPFRRAPRPPGPRAARRRWRRRGTCPPRGPAPPWPGTGRPWWRRPRRPPRRRPPLGSGPAGGPRRRRTAACRTPRPGRPGRGRPPQRCPSGPVAAVSGSRWRSGGAVASPTPAPARRARRGRVGHR